jgi:fatty-acid desaturase
MSVSTIYLHRNLGHRTLDCSKSLEHVFRFIHWLHGWDWDNYQQGWVAQHRKHHKYSDTPNDPHSPHHIGVSGIFDFKHNDPNRPYYLTPEEIQQYAPDIVSPTDWVQRNIYNPSKIQVRLINWKRQEIWFDLSVSMLVLFAIFYLFVSPVVAVLLVIFQHRVMQRYIIPYINNYLNHKSPLFTYNKGRNDQSRILSPIGILMGGEELHANHHNEPQNPRFSRRWFEFDISWMYIKIFMLFGLIKLRNRYEN